MNSVDENGTAIRAWGEQGGEVFVTWSDSDDRLPTAIRRCIEKDIRIMGPGCPPLPSGAFEGSPSPDEDRDPDRLSTWLLELHCRLPGAAVWLEAGTSVEHLENSNGFSGRQADSGWQLVLSMPGSRRITVWFSTGGPGLDLPAVGGVVEAAEAWRGRPEPAPGPVRLEGPLLAAVLASLGERFVARAASPGHVPAAGGGRIAPAGTRLVAHGRPGRFDGEGVASRDVVLIEDGRLAGRLVDLSAARDLGLQPTGSARRDSYRDYPSARPAALSLTGTGPDRGDAGPASLANGTFWRDASGQGTALILPSGATIGVNLDAWLATHSGEPIPNRVYVSVPAHLPED